MNNFFKLGIYILLLGSMTFLNAKEKVDSGFGRRSDTIVIDINSIPEPTLSESKKAFITENKFGFDVVNSELNWVTESFLKAIKPGMIVMDVGAGFGALTRLALDKGAIVINNEISEKQQLYNLKYVKKNQKDRLYFNNQDIRNASLPNDSLDAVIFHRILHFFSGKDIENILTKSHQWLKPGGKIYIVMMSKDHIAFRDKIKYDESKSWPGENLVIVKKHLPDQAYALPETLHVVSTKTLQKALNKIGFQVEQSNFVSMKKFGSESNRDGKEAVGTIGVKP